MIRAVLVVGWLGLVLLFATAVTGYRIADETQTQQHLALALFPTGALLFADLCVLVYLQGTLRLVRRTSRELGLSASWLADQRRLALATSLWPAAGAAVLVTLFGSGFPVFVESWPLWVHHAAFALAALLHLVFLLRAARQLREGEAHLAAFGSAAEAAGGL
jgi:integral membrane sensor domain MASE1